jgi:hypothetical protein
VEEAVGQATASMLAGWVALARRLCYPLVMRDDLRPEYGLDYSKAIRGKYYGRLLWDGPSLVVPETMVPPLGSVEHRRKSHCRQKEGEDGMPTISMFYGILIRMFFRDIEKHHMPHIHADYQGQVAVYSIPDGTLLAGELPPNKHKLVVAWIEIHQEDLLADWNLAVSGKKPFPIRGLDQ